MTAGAPLWRRAFDRAERAVGAPLEEAVQTRRFADVVVLSLRAQLVVRRAIAHGQRELLHLGNLPARSDVERLNRQVAALRHELREVSARLEERDGAP